MESFLKFLFNYQHLCEGAWITIFALSLNTKKIDEWIKELTNWFLKINQLDTTTFNYFFVTSRSSYKVGFFFREHGPIFSLYTIKMDLFKKKCFTNSDENFTVILIKFYDIFRYFKVTMIRKRWYPMCCHSTSGLVSSGSGPRLINTKPWG